jgi:hypothetical protein
VRPNFFRKYSVLGQCGGGVQSPQSARPGAKLPAAAKTCTRASHDEAVRGPVAGALQQEVAKWEAAMRALEGSPKRRSYWREGSGVRYRAALEAVEAADAPPAVAPASQPAG